MNLKDRYTFNRITHSLPILSRFIWRVVPASLILYMSWGALQNVPQASAIEKVLSNAEMNSISYFVVLALAFLVVVLFHTIASAFSEINDLYHYIRSNSIHTDNWRRGFASHVEYDVEFHDYVVKNDEATELWSKSDKLLAEIKDHAIFLIDKYQVDCSLENVEFELTTRSDLDLTNEDFRYYTDDRPNIILIPESYFFHYAKFKKIELFDSYLMNRIIRLALAQDIERLQLLNLDHETTLNRAIEKIQPIELTVELMNEVSARKTYVSIENDQYYTMGIVVKDKDTLNEFDKLYQELKSIKDVKASIE